MMRKPALFVIFVFAPCCRWDKVNIAKATVGMIIIG